MSLGACLPPVVSSIVPIAPHDFTALLAPPPHSCSGTLHRVPASSQPTSPLPTPSFPRLQVITIGALIMELAAALVLGATVLTYDYFNSKDSGFF